MLSQQKLFQTIWLHIEQRIPIRCNDFPDATIVILTLYGFTIAEAPAFSNGKKSASLGFTPGLIVYLHPCGKRSKDISVFLFTQEMRKENVCLRIFEDEETEWYSRLEIFPHQEYLYPEAESK